MEHEKYKQKLLTKLFADEPKVITIDEGLGKKASVLKFFRVGKRIFNLEFGFQQKIELVGGMFYPIKQPYLIKYNSRSAEGGYTYFKEADIANALNIDESDIRPHIEHYQNLTTPNLEVVKKVFEKRMKKSEREIIKKLV